ncbi:MAG: acylphosphatase [Terriglobales bacterium]
MAAARFEIRGEVQGVGFRQFALRTALRLELSGWVRNRDDGSVEAVASGADAALDCFERELGQGPLGARVHQVVRHRAEASWPSGFTIK